MAQTPFKPWKPGIFLALRDRGRSGGHISETNFFAGGKAIEFYIGSTVYSFLILHPRARGIQGVLFINLLLDKE